jgi:hypothetical protein
MKNVSKKLGVDTGGQKLTKALCMAKVRKLRQGLKKGLYSGALRKYAVYYANWYTYRAKSGPRTAKKVRKSTSKKAA